MARSYGRRPSDRAEPDVPVLGPSPVEMVSQNPRIELMSATRTTAPPDSLIRDRRPLPISSQRKSTNPDGLTFLSTLRMALSVTPGGLEVHYILFCFMWMVHRSR